MPNVYLRLGDAVKWAREYSGEPFHAILCDAPYHLTSITKRVGAGKSEVGDTRGVGGPFKSVNRGFMGKQWDGGDLAFNPETWEAFGEILYPGAFGMAFASSRGWHRMAVAIEDAGFVIHPSLFGWSYGSGFPKATRVKENSVFSGHRYGLQCLKPALEPIIVFQKPYEGRPIDNITETGAGVLNVDGGRVGTREKEMFTGVKRISSFGGDAQEYKNKNVYERSAKPLPDGRWPANFYLDAEAARRLDEQSGVTGQRVKGGYVQKAPVMGTNTFNNGVPYTDNRVGREPIDEPGGASRFFFRVSEQIDEADPVRYVAKASRKERDGGLEGFEKVKGSAEYRPKDDGEAGIQSRLHGATIKGRNPHPTVKPLALTRYLATLLLPPAEYAPRRLFVPFAGVASECIGAMQAGWDEVIGVEITEEYMPIANARVEYWKAKEHEKLSAPRLLPD